MNTWFLTTHVPSPPPNIFLHFSTKDRVLFAKRLSFLLSANISLLEGITIIKDQTKNVRKRRVYEMVMNDIAAGQFLSTSLIKYQHLFGSLTINLIRIGETHGILVENLKYLAEELSKRQQLKSKVKSALIYPIFITITTFSVTSLLIMYIFPKILPIFSSLNITLPVSTRILLHISHFLKDWGIVTIGVSIVAIVVAVAMHKMHPSLRFASNWLLIRTPIIGNIIRSYNCANFCRTLHLSLRSGVGLSDALVITSSVTDNELYKTAYETFMKRIIEGQRISTTMLNYPRLFPDMLPHLLQVGETTGSLSASLSYLAQLYENEVDESTRNLSSMVEPILLIVMGLLVGIIAVSVITPIYEVTQMLGGKN